MALDSDEFIKNEVFDVVGEPGDSKLRIFQQTSNFDHKDINEGGLTFNYKNLTYGSCDAMWYVEDSFHYIGLNKDLDIKPIVALEGTDCLSRGSNGNAQYQRFHHALGAVKNNVLGVYYLKQGESKVQEDLFYMAYQASKIEKGTYLILQDLNIVKEILELNNEPKLQKILIQKQLENMKEIWNRKFKEQYKNSWDVFAQKRSTVIFPSSIIKVTGRNFRNFTESSQRAGHIAVGEMYLSKYFFPEKKLYYVFPRMSLEEKNKLDSNKNNKEWSLLRREENVEIITRDEIIGLDTEMIESFEELADKPLKGIFVSSHNKLKNQLLDLFKKQLISISN